MPWDWLQTLSAAITGGTITLVASWFTFRHNFRMKQMELLAIADLAQERQAIDAEDEARRANDAAIVALIEAAARVKSYVLVRGLSRKAGLEDRDENTLRDVLVAIQTARIRTPDSIRDQLVSVQLQATALVLGIQTVQHHGSYDEQELLEGEVQAFDRAFNEYIVALQEIDGFILTHR